MDRWTNEWANDWTSGPNGRRPFESSDEEDLSEGTAGAAHIAAAAEADHVSVESSAVKYNPSGLGIATEDVSSSAYQARPVVHQPTDARVSATEHPYP